MCLPTMVALEERAPRGGTARGVSRVTIPTQNDLSMQERMQMLQNVVWLILAEYQVSHEKRYSLLPLNIYLSHRHENYYTPGLDLLSDKALIGFLKVIIEVNRDIQLLAYRDDERLSMGKENGFLVRMGFGLHAGWAIEGAVGSLQKVDATYLSPHVNMAARMEVATRQFGVSLLMTRSFHKVSPRASR